MRPQLLSVSNASRRGLAGLLLVGAHAVSAAEPALVDPTRPPGVVATPAAAPRVAPAPAVATAPAPWPTLQSIRVVRDGTSSALLDGRLLKIGERIGEATLVGIDADGVTVRRGRAEQRLVLLPEVVKTAAAARPVDLPSAVAAVPKGLR